MSAALYRGPDRYDRMELREQARRVCLGMVVGIEPYWVSEADRADIARELAHRVAELCDRLDDAEALLEARS